MDLTYLKIQKKVSVTLIEVCYVYAGLQNHFCHITVVYMTSSSKHLISYTRLKNKPRERQALW